MPFAGTEAPPRATAPTEAPTRLFRPRPGRAMVQLQWREEEVLCPLNNCCHGRVQGPESQKDVSAGMKWEEDDMEGGDRDQM